MSVSSVRRYRGTWDYRLCLFLQIVYTYLARKLTDWENNETQTAYDNSYIIKLACFYAVNGYSSLFFIAVRLYGCISH